MFFTGKLGTVNSALGHIALGRTPVSVFIESFSDTLTFSDLEVSNYLLSDTLTFDDEVDPVFSTSENLVFVDSFVEHHVASVSMTDTVTFSDYFIFQLTDTLTLTDSFAGLVWRVGHLTETLTFSESQTENAVLVRTMFDSLSLNETLTEHLVKAVSLTDTMSFSDTEVGIRSHPFADTLTLTDTETEFISKKFHDSLDFSDVISHTTILNRSLGTDQLVLFDGILYHATLHKSVSDSLTFSDGINGFKVHPLIPESLSFSDSNVATSSKPLYETLALSDNFATNKVQHRSLNDSLVFFESISENKVIHVSWEDVIFTHSIANRLGPPTIIPNDFMTGIRVGIGHATEAITFTDSMHRAVNNSTISDTLTFSETESVHTRFVRGFSETVTFIDLLNEDAVLHRAISDTLPFDDGFGIKLIQGTVRPSPPDTIGTVTVRSQVVIVGVGNSIILPAPEFNDYEANQGKIAVKRSMEGRFRVYAKRTDREKLNWHFVLPKFKADELEAFILAEINNDLDITDFKGNKWHAKILSDSVDFTETGRWEPCGNKVEVTIEFEGVKYA